MSIRSEPHFEVSSRDLAAWIEKQGKTNWWNVDGDLLLTDRLTFPCPGDELADALRQIDRPLLIQDPMKRSAETGRRIVNEKEIDSLANVLGNNIQYSGEKPFWADDRVFYCCWKDANDEWLLTEDKETSKSSERDEIASRAKK